MQHPRMLGRLLWRLAFDEQVAPVSFPHDTGSTPSRSSSAAARRFQVT
jgi:hypothetical protein